MFPRRLLALALALGLLASGSAAGHAAADPRIVGVYPNPVSHGDAGEFVVVEFDRETNLTGWRLTDGTTAATLPNRTVAGSVAFATEPERARAAADAEVLALNGTLRLANGGDEIRLARSGTTLDRLRYERAPEGELLRRTDEGPEWRPLGATEFRPFAASDARAVAFALPDAPAVALDALRSAEERVLLAAYSFTSDRVADALRGAAAAGANVTVVVEGGPVGGATRAQASALDSLAEAGVEVRVFAGPRTRYAFHHAKYAVVDDRAVVLSENWKPAGVGGRASRGWGVAVESEAAADRLAHVFRADARWKDTEPWAAYRENRSFRPAEPATEAYPSRFEPETGAVESVTLLTAPDNAESGVIALLESADDSIRVQQASVGGPTQPFLRTLRSAARRGVRVRLLLSSAWYVEAENRELVRSLNDWAERGGHSFEARLAEPRSRFAKVHNKGVVVDGERVLVGSINWNNHSVRENREVAVVLASDELAEYYGRIFGADWRGGAWRAPLGVVAVTAVGVGGAARLATRRVTFER